MANHERVSNANQARHILKKRRKRHRMVGLRDPEPPSSKLGKSTRNTGPNSTNGAMNDESSFEICFLDEAKFTRDIVAEVSLQVESLASKGNSFLKSSTS
ncbi:hypothetical protein TorRG33x02_002910 [Trema orientale]|uniref:Uncharacterized protein n=1 Tax=Trema orientale TaxID=63057 RepID=A0A2P5G1U1_TREOI|nr:hypothetical protein TorRG33x02_002910 [Trema orientale]